MRRVADFPSRLRVECSMRQSLILHPHSKCFAAMRVEAGIVRRRQAGLELCYVVNGDIGDIRLPAIVPSARADELWQHTCFEMFFRTTDSSSYYEFNFSPSTQWAVYRFANYRSKRVTATEVSAINIEVESSADRYRLHASFDLDFLWRGPPGSSRFGLSAVIEGLAGDKAYWALRHPEGKPDFHHPESCLHELIGSCEPS